MFIKIFLSVFISLIVISTGFFIYQYVNYGNITIDVNKPCCEACQKYAVGLAGEKSCLQSKEITSACQEYLKADLVKEKECANQETETVIVSDEILIPAQFKNIVWAGSLKIDVEGNVPTPGAPAGIGCLGYWEYSIHRTIEISELKIDTQQLSWSEKAKDLGLTGTESESIINDIVAEEIPGYPEKAISVIGKAKLITTNPYIFMSKCGTPVVSVINSPEIEFNGYMDLATNTLFPFEYFSNNPMSINNLKDCTLPVIGVGGCMEFSGQTTELKPENLFIQGFSFEIIENNSLKVIRPFWQGPLIQNIGTGEYELLEDLVSATFSGILNINNN